MLPTFFVIFATALLCAAVYSVWQGLRAALGVGYVDPAYGAAASDESATLSDEKHAVLRALKDLEYEHAVGKISEEDFKRLDVQYRQRAREVLRALDAEVGTHRAEAEKLLAEHVAAATRSKKKAIGGAKKRAAVKAPAAAVAAPAPEKVAEAEPRECPKCGTVNDTDATFCKKCATRIESKDEARTAARTASDEAEAAAKAAPAEADEGDDEGDDEAEASASGDAKADAATSAAADAAEGEDDDDDDDDDDDEPAAPKAGSKEDR